MKKEITINDLAMMVQRGFEDIQKELRKTAKKEEMDKHFDRIENKLDRIEKRLSCLITKKKFITI
jgi:hypothetical protein